MENNKAVEDFYKALDRFLKPITSLDATPDKWVCNDCAETTNELDVVFKPWSSDESRCPSCGSEDVEQIKNTK